MWSGCTPEPPSNLIRLPVNTLEGSVRQKHDPTVTPVMQGMCVFGAVVYVLVAMKQNVKTYRKFRVSTASVVEHNRPEQERMIKTVL